MRATSLLLFVALALTAGKAWAAPGVSSGTEANDPSARSVGPNDPSAPGSTDADGEWRPFDYGERAWIVRGTAVLGGTAVGLGTGLALMFGPPLSDTDVPLFKPGAPPLALAAVAVPTLVVFTASSVLAIWAFSEGVMLLGRNLFTAIPMGLILGGMAGALIGGLSFATVMVAAYPFEVIDTGRIQGIPALLGMGLLAGGLWGGLSGLIPGLFLGPTIRFVLGPVPAGGPPLQGVPNE